jgi:hypothetical protein
MKKAASTQQQYVDTKKDTSQKVSFVMSSGDEGARTPDLDSAIVALFQLSYIPERAVS